MELLRRRLWRFRLLTIERNPDPWCLSAAQVTAVRRHDRRWAVKLQRGQRPTICRECGGTFTGSRLKFAFYDIKAKMCLYQGFLHQDLAVCAASKLEQEYLQFQGECVKDYLADPSKYQEYV